MTVGSGGQSVDIELKSAPARNSAISSGYNNFLEKDNVHLIKTNSHLTEYDKWKLRWNCKYKNSSVDTWRSQN